MFPAFDSAPNDPKAVLIKPRYFWQASAGQIQVCLQVPYPTGAYPTNPLFGETTCVQPVPIVNTSGEQPNDNEEVVLPLPYTPNNPQ